MVTCRRPEGPTLRPLGLCGAFRLAAVDFLGARVDFPLAATFLDGPVVRVFFPVALERVRVAANLSSQDLLDHAEHGLDPTV